MISQGDAPLITPRHEVRICWNEEAARRACKQNKWQLKKCGQKNLALPEKIELAIGMKVKETANMETNMDIANGSRGEIVGIVFEEGEVSTSEEVIQEIPLVKLARTRLSALQGLTQWNRGGFLIEVIKGGKNVKKSAQRTQFDHSCICFQTNPLVIIDIKTPPSGPQTLFDSYVALSRSSGWSTIRIFARPLKSCNEKTRAQIKQTIELDNTVGSIRKFKTSSERRKQRETTQKETNTST
jgi:hypothetical protein